MSTLRQPFTAAEAAALAPYFTNLDQPVFALVNLPETVKGALFARYSRSPKPLRRLFLDEFLDQVASAGATATPAVGVERAERLYARVFNEYGDDSVAQLGGVHVAVEDASNILTKVLERGRLMAYLEQSTRYIPYDARLGGRYRYYRPAEVLDSPLGARYVADMDAMFDAYASCLAQMLEWARDTYPKGDYMLLKTLVDAGIPVAIGSDGAMNPFLNIQLATNHGSESITRDHAVEAYTRMSAYAEMQEKEKGTIAPGKLADLAVLSQDIFTVPATRLPDTRSILTILNGKVVYDVTAAAVK